MAKGAKYGSVNPPKSPKQFTGPKNPQVVKGSGGRGKAAIFTQANHTLPTTGAPKQGKSKSSA